jgi:hypothetical protein
LDPPFFLSFPLFRQGRIDVRSSRPPVKEDEVDRDARRQSAEKQKSVKDSVKKGGKKKNLDRQALEARRAKSRQRGEPEEESPSDDDGGDGDDDSDDSEGMASCLDRILEGPPRGDVDVPWTGAPKVGPGGSHHPVLTLLLRLCRVEPSRILNLPLHQRRIAGLSTG